MFTSPKGQGACGATPSGSAARTPGADSAASSGDGADWAVDWARVRRCAGPFLLGVAGAVAMLAGAAQAILI